MVLLFFIVSIILALSIAFLRKKNIIQVFTTLFVLLHISFTIYCLIHIGKTDFDFFTYDSAGVLLLSVLSILTISTIYHGFIYVKNDTPKRYAYYHSALIILVMAMSGAYLANGMTTVWIFVEATTLAVAALIYHDRTQAALEATWKYIFVCSVGIALAYIGILFLGFAFKNANLLHLSFQSLAQIATQHNPLYLKIVFIFVLVGYSTKMGLFPMHTVTIDAHTVAPAPISAFISTTLMNVGFLAIFRVYSVFAYTSILGFMNKLLIISGFLSLLISAGYLLKAKHNKRMLAYSSLENMGIIAIALGIGGIGYYVAFLHIILHSFIKAGLFYQIGQSYKIMGTYSLDDSGNYMKLYPAGAIVLLIGLFCITAIPPSGLFITELMLLKAMILKNQYLYLIFTSLFLCVIVYALITRVLHILYSSPRNNNFKFQPQKVNPIQTFSQYILFSIVILFCFIQPEPIKNIINSIIQNLPK